LVIDYGKKKRRGSPQHPKRWESQFGYEEKGGRLRGAHSANDAAEKTGKMGMYWYTGLHTCPNPRKLKAKERRTEFMLNGKAEPETDLYPTKK